MSTRVLRDVAILWATFALVFLWGAACRAEIPLIQVQNVGPTLNRATARVQGVVARSPAYDPVAERWTFWVDDGTAQVLVIMNQGENHALLEGSPVPRIGDRVTVSGTIKVRTPKGRDALVSLTFSEPEHLEIERPSAQEFSIADVANDAAEARYSKVLFKGQVREVRQLYTGETVLRIRDRTGEIDVIYGQDLVYLGGEPTSVFPGDSVSVRGAIVIDQGQPRIVLDSASGLQRLSSAVSLGECGPIGELGATAGASVGGGLGRWRRVEGAVTDVIWRSEGSDSVGLKCVLDDGTGEVALLLSQEVWNQVAERVEMRPGVWLDVQGAVVEYMGELELIPELAGDVQMIRAPVELGADETIHLAPLLPTATPSVVYSPTPTATPPAVYSPTPTMTAKPVSTSPVSATPVPSSTPTALATAPATRAPAVGDSLMKTGLIAQDDVDRVVTVEGRIEQATLLSVGVK